MPRTRSGSGSAALRAFSYTVQSTDTAPTSGLSMTSSIDLNGGAISGGTTCFTAPSLTGVLISSGPSIIYLTAGTATWTVPPGWNSANNTIEALGAGGQGAGSGGGGAGGGGYAKIANFSATVGAVIPVTIGAGGSGTNTVFNNTSTLVATAGANASGSSGGAGGSIASEVGSVKYAGGNGGAGNSGSGGSGGGGGGAGGASGQWRRRWRWQ